MTPTRTITPEQWHRSQIMCTLFPGAAHVTAEHADIRPRVCPNFFRIAMQMEFRGRKWM